MKKGIEKVIDESRGKVIREDSRGKSKCCVSPSSFLKSSSGRVILTAASLTIRHSIPAEVLPNVFFGDADGACNPNWIDYAKIS